MDHTPLGPLPLKTLALYRAGCFNYSGLVLYFVQKCLIFSTYAIMVSPQKPRAEAPMPLFKHDSWFLTAPKFNTAWHSGREGPVSALQPHPGVSRSPLQPPPGHLCPSPPTPCSPSPPLSFPARAASSLRPHLRPPAWVSASSGPHWTSLSSPHSMAVDLCRGAHALRLGWVSHKLDLRPMPTGTI